MHQILKDKFKELSLKLSEVEARIGCPKNYLSRFVNGEGTTLPPKWEKKIQAFIDGIEKELTALPVKNPDLLRPWIKQIEDYCTAVGKDPEGLIADHKALAGLKRFAEAAVSSGNVQIQDLTSEHPKSNFAVNTLSNWAEENRKKKIGIK
jgi:transcriptional regulator with XRE-family HTH domain